MENSDILELFEVKFSDDLKALPANSPANHAHVRELSAIGHGANNDKRKDFNIWDVVATMLFRFSSYELSRFLDSRKKTYEFRQSLVKGPEPREIVIWRKDSEVLVSEYPNEL